MGLFDKIFQKKECDICGGEIGLLGNRKLEDGNMCKECAKKLSPFMTDRRESTIAEINEHLAYREENERQLASFNPTLVLGNYTRIYIDENAGKFIVTDRDEWSSRNPDIIDIAQVTCCNINVEEHRHEIHPPRPPQREGEPPRPPMPPRIEYSYEFDVEIFVDSPYFDRIGFELSRERPKTPYCQLYRDYEEQGYAIQEALSASAAEEAPAAPVFAQAAPAAGWVCACGAEASGKFCPECGAPKPAEEGWACSCGAVNRGKFCAECGAKRPPEAPAYQCDKCGWQPEDPLNPPKFCPECGDRFDENDIV